MRVLVTGMSGVGKSTVLAELAALGYSTVDTDYDGWTTPEGEWDEPRMDALLEANDEVIVSGTVANQGRFYPKFDHIVVLTAPLEVILERVTNRKHNPYGHSAAQREEIRHNHRYVEPLLRASATIELDARDSPAVLATKILSLPLRP